MGLFIATAIVPLLFGLWAQMKVKRTFAKYSQVRPRNGMSGAEAAAAVLRSSGLPNLQIRPVAGRLTDHYDPRSRTLNLSADVGQASSLAALGVAAHEAGHAIQDAKRYAPMRVRQTLVPAATIGQSLWFLPVVARPHPRAHRARDDRPRPVRGDRALPARHAAGRVRRVQARARRARGPGPAGRRRGRPAPAPCSTPRR